MPARPLSDNALLESVLAASPDEVRARLTDAGVDPERLLDVLTDVSDRLDRTLADQKAIDDVATMAIDDVEQELREAGVDPDALSERVLSRLPELEG